MLRGCLQRAIPVLKNAITCDSSKRTGEMSLPLPSSFTKWLKCSPESSFPDETCDVIIDINEDGSCKFKIIPLEPKRSSVNGHIEELCCSSNTSNGNSTNGQGSKKKRQLDSVKDETGFPPLTNYVALDCEFVGVRNDQSALGRCSIVDCEGQVLCDLYAMPEDPITHYRTRWSGITRNHMKNAIPLEFALAKISNILEGKIVVGHDLTGDFKVLGFRPRREFIRDTSTFKGLTGPFMAGKKSLKSLALEHLGLQIQVGSHCSIQDARAAMSLYRLVRHEWESSLLAKNKTGNQSNIPEIPEGNNKSGISKRDSLTDSCVSPDYVNGIQTDACTNNSEISCNVKDVEVDFGTDEKDISGTEGNEHVDDVAHDDYWDIKNPRDCKVDCSNVHPVLENTESKLSVLNKIRSESGLVLKAKSRKTKKSKHRNGLQTGFGQINTNKLSVNDYFSAYSQVNNNQGNKSNLEIVDSSVIDLTHMCDVVMKRAEEKVSKTLRPNDCSKPHVELSSTVDHLYDDQFWPEFEDS
ncbi:interferon-stimulated 20 kDa exonuclease-like 2 isoform X2 [Dreissena polymorpha]|nr:interferon-stimulated 20 kDa exonuclease-like 2 isoform X2 [Dreissena polymorpha]